MTGCLQLNQWWPIVIFAGFSLFYNVPLCFSLVSDETIVAQTMQNVLFSNSSANESKKWTYVKNSQNLRTHWLCTTLYLSVRTGDNNNNNSDEYKNNKNGLCPVYVCVVYECASLLNNNDTTLMDAKSSWLNYVDGQTAILQCFRWRFILLVYKVGYFLLLRFVWFMNFGIFSNFILCLAKKH